MQVITNNWWIIKLLKTLCFVLVHWKSINEMYIASPLWISLTSTTIGAWISYQMLIKALDEITHPRPNFTSDLALNRRWSKGMGE